MTDPTILDVLFIDDDGRTFCYSHGGSALRAKVTTEPFVRVNSVLRTGDRSWLVVPVEALRSTGPGCEVCERLTIVGSRQ